MKGMKCFFYACCIVFILGSACSNDNTKTGNAENKTQTGSAILNAVGNAKISAGASQGQEQETTKQIEGQAKPAQ